MHPKLDWRPSDGNSEDNEVPSPALNENALPCFAISPSSLDCASNGAGDSHAPAHKVVLLRLVALPCSVAMVCVANGRDTSRIGNKSRCPLVLVACLSLDESNVVR